MHHRQSARGRSAGHAPGFENLVRGLVPAGDDIGAGRAGCEREKQSECGNVKVFHDALSLT